MQRIDGTRIEINRGDVLSLSLSLKVDEKTPYIFKPNDKIKFTVHTKNRLGDNPVLQKDITVAENTETVDIICTSEETKIGDYINKPVDYWYEVELNDEYTVIGYDNNGPKIFRLYPEGNENE